MFDAKEKTVSVKGSFMRYAVFGRDIKPLVIIPGLSVRKFHGSAIPLSVSYQIFAKDYRVYVFDKKEEPEENCTVSSMADDLAEAMRTLGIHHAFVMGVSEGGMIAQYLALNYPSLVQKLVLAVTASRPNDTLKNVIHSWITMCGEGRFEEIIPDMLEKVYSEDYVRKYGRFFPMLKKIIAMEDPKRFIALAKACLSCDCYERLNEIRIPVFVIGGRKDKIVGSEASPEIAEKLQCELYIYDDLGHSAYEEGKDFNQKVYDFFRS